MKKKKPYVVIYCPNCGKQVKLYKLHEPGAKTYIPCPKCGDTIVFGLVKEGK